MGTKLKPGKFDCFGNAKDDEPMFIILGRDISGPVTVLYWCLERATLILNGKKPVEDVEMIEEALQCAMDMAKYKGEEHEDFKNLSEQVKGSIRAIRGEDTGERFTSTHSLRPGNGIHGTDRKE